MGVYWIRFKLNLYTASRSASGSLKRCKLLHGNKSRIKAYSPKSEQLALAA